MYNIMFHVIRFLVLVVFLIHDYFRYILGPLITHSENESTRKHAIEKRRVGPGNIDHLSRAFPLQPMRYIFKVSMG